jgi:hypothetical protein
VAALGKLVASLIMETAEFEKGTDKATQLTEKAARDIERRLAGIQTAATAVGTVIGDVLVKAFQLAYEKTVSVIDGLDKINTASERLQLPSQFLQEMEYVGKLADISFESLTLGFKKLAVSATAAVSGNQEVAEAFKAIGIETEQLRGKTLPELIDLLANGFAGSEGEIEKVAVAVKLLGKSGEQMIPLLNSGADSIRKLSEEARSFGFVTGPEAVKVAAEFKDNLDRIGFASRAAAQELAGPLIKSLGEVLAIFVEGRKAGLGFWNSLSLVSGPNGSVSANIEVTTKSIARLKAELAGVNNPNLVDLDEKLFGKGRTRAQLLTEKLAPEIALQEKRLALLNKMKDAEYSAANKPANGGFDYDPTVKRRVVFDDVGGGKAQGLSVYEKLTRDLKVAMQELVAFGYDPLLSSEKQLIKLREETALEVKAGKLTEAERANVLALAEGNVAKQKAFELDKGLFEARQKISAMLGKSLADYEKENQALASGNESLRSQTQEVGLTEASLVDLVYQRQQHVIAMEQERLATLIKNQADQSEIQALERRIELLKQQADATRGLGVAKIENQNRSDEQAKVDEARRAGEAFEDALVRSALKGWKSLRETIKAQVLEVTIAPIIKESLSVLLKQLSAFLVPQGGNGNTSTGLGALLKEGLKLLFPGGGGASAPGDYPSTTTGFSGFGGYSFDAGSGGGNTVQITQYNTIDASVDRASVASALESAREQSVQDVALAMSRGSPGFTG